MITDAQVHLFPPDTPENPWPRDGGRGAPRIPHYSAEQMIGAMDAVGVDRSVIVPPAWAGDQNDYALEACRVYPERFAIMGRIDPWAPGSAERLKSWLAQPGMLGIRTSARWGTRETSFEQALKDGSLGWFWEACDDLDIPVKFLIRDDISGVQAIATDRPNLRLIIDHMATVSAPTVELAFRNLETLLDMARYPNVNVQVSTATHYSQMPYPHEDVQPMLRRIHNAYGAGRMLWGADITQLPKGRSTYAECLRLWQEGLPFLSASDRERILGGTVTELLRWPEGV